MLEVRGLCKHFGGIRAVDDCSFTVETGRITALIGPNGAGKTTAFNCISRTMTPTSGEVWLDGRAHRRGCARTRSPGWACPHLPDLAQPRRHDGAGERHLPVAHRAAGATSSARP